MPANCCLKAIKVGSEGSKFLLVTFTISIPVKSYVWPFELSMGYMHNDSCEEEKV